MKRIKKICLIIICALCIGVEQEVLAITELEGNLYALSAVLMDGESGRVLYEKESNVKRPMASTTKIMTCIIALEYGDLNSLVGITESIKEKLDWARHFYDMSSLEDNKSNDKQKQKRKKQLKK